MKQTEQSIISTLAYYHALRVPSLTFPEIFYYLTPLNYAESTLSDGVANTPSFYMVKKSLKSLVEQGIVVSSRGHYALAKIGDPKKRIEYMRNQDKKGEIFSSVARLLKYIPYVRMIGLAGSVAINSARPESDIDVLIVSSKGRIWTTRILVTLATHITGKRRYGSLITNRICLNHYVAENTPSEPHVLPLAHTYAQMLLYWKDRGTNDLIINNPWIRNILPNVHGMRSYVYSQRINGLGLLGKKIVEKVLDYTIGSALEYMVKKYQLRRIQNNLGDSHPDQLELVLSDQELRFHYPFSRSKDAFLRYKKTCGQYVDNVTLS